MADIFNTDSKFAGVFKGTTFALTFAGADTKADGALVQSLQLSYARQISRFWELGSHNQYYIAGRTEGSGGLNQIVGPNGFVTKLVASLGDVCNADKNTINLSAGSETCAFKDGQNSASQSVKLSGVVSTRITMGANSQNFVVDSGVEIMFTSLETA